MLVIIMWTARKHQRHRFSNDDEESNSLSVSFYSLCVLCGLENFSLRSNDERWCALSFRFLWVNILKRLCRKAMTINCVWHHELLKMIFALMRSLLVARTFEKIPSFMHNIMMITIFSPCWRRKLKMIEIECCEIRVESENSMLHILESFYTCHVADIYSLHVHRAPSFHREFYHSIFNLSIRDRVRDCDAIGLESKYLSLLAMYSTFLSSRIERNSTKLSKINWFSTQCCCCLPSHSIFPTNRCLFICRHTQVDYKLPKLST